MPAVGFDKGHNDEVYNVAYNPITDHVVAVGKKYLRFFGIKEGVEDSASADRDSKLSAHESKMWAKKGVYGKGSLPKDIMCVAFGSDGTTYAGSADGCIFRFAEQMNDMSVKAHPHGSDDPKEVRGRLDWHGL